MNVCIIVDDVFVADIDMVLFLRAFDVSTAKCSESLPLLIANMKSKVLTHAILILNIAQCHNYDRSIPDLIVTYFNSSLVSAQFWLMLIF